MKSRYDDSNLNTNKSVQMDNKFKEGDVVLERTRPNQKLIIKRFFNNLYYCMEEENPKRKELVYLERDLKPC